MTKLFWVQGIACFTLFLLFVAAFINGLRAEKEYKQSLYSTDMQRVEAYFKVALFTGFLFLLSFATILNKLI